MPPPVHLSNPRPLPISTNKVWPGSGPTITAIRDRTIASQKLIKSYIWKQQWLSASLKFIASFHFVQPYYEHAVNVQVFLLTSAPRDYALHNQDLHKKNQPSPSDKQNLQVNRNQSDIVYKPHGRCFCLANKYYA